MDFAVDFQSFHLDEAGAGGVQRHPTASVVMRRHVTDSFDLIPCGKLHGSVQECGRSVQSSRFWTT